MSDPPHNKKDEFQPRESISEQYFTSAASEEQFSLVQTVKKLFYRLFGPRKYKRTDIPFNNPMRVLLTTDEFSLEVVPSNFSKGGMGIEIPSSTHSLKIDQKVSLKLVSASKEPLELEGRVRYVVSSNRSRNPVGIQFVEVSGETLSKIEKYLK